MRAQILLYDWSIKERIIMTLPKDRKLFLRQILTMLGHGHQHLFIIVTDLAYGMFDTPLSHSSGRVYG